MEFILLSDVHWLTDNPICRTDDAAAAQMEKLKYVYGYCRKNGEITTVLQAGDLNNRPRSWQLLPIQMLFFRVYDDDVQTACVFGQHDLYMYSKNREATNLGALGMAWLVDILDHAGQNKGVYGASWGEEVPRPEEETEFKILVTHRSIATESIYPSQVYDPAFAFLKMYPKYNLILCGDIHREFVVEHKNRYIVNTGPLLRRSVDEWDHKPCFYIYDTDKKSLERHEIPHKPAEEVMTREHIDKKEDINKMLQDFIDKVKGGKLKGINFNDKLLSFLKENEINQQVVDIISEMMEEE